MRGILASWAVPNGPPLEPGKRRLAVHTEDHPIEYLTFHGVIPDGYGAGSMTIWDTGTYELIEEKPNELKIKMKGTRLDGEWVIVQTKQNEGRDWLMIKHGTPPKNDPLLSKIVPMLAASANEPFDSPDFTYEPKWDGVRTIAFVDGGEVRLQTRNLLDCTKQYPEATQAAEALTGAYHAILDGEIVALEPKGVPSFQRLQPRMHVSDESTVRKLRKSTPVIYEVFDILYADGEDLTRKPLRDRLRRLDEALTPMGSIRRSEGFPGAGVALFEAAREQGIEGIVAKRLDSIYLPGARSPAWVKIKAFRTMECVIGGWTAGQGGRTKTLGALLIGVYRDGKLQPVGHVGTGFDERTLRDLLKVLEEHESPTSPFATEPRTNQPARWCLPELVCEVEYVEITRDGTLRHPTYRGLRQDVDPRDATGEERRESARKAQEAAKRAATTARAPSDNGDQGAREPENAYVLANDMATLVWMANYTAIEIHPRLARVDDPEKPDNVMIDLDPAEGATWDDVKEVAHVVKAVLDDLGLIGFPKTTGSRGIHVLVPIARRYSFEESRAFALRVGQLARERLPKLVTLEFSKAKRRSLPRATAAPRSSRSSGHSRPLSRASASSRGRSPFAPAGRGRARITSRRWRTFALRVTRYAPMATSGSLSSAARSAAVSRHSSPSESHPTRS